MSIQSPGAHPPRQPVVIALIAVSSVAIAAIAAVVFLVGRQSSAPESSTAATSEEAFPQRTQRESAPQVSSHMNGAAVAQGIAKIVTASYGVGSVTDVQCPDGEPVQRGHTFICTLKADGSNAEVTVTLTDDTGTYEVSRPR